MKTHFIEATDGVAHGKFMLGRFEAGEVMTRSALPGLELESIFRNSGGARKFGFDYTLVLDLQTAQGAGFLLTDRFLVRSDLEKLTAWVCPMYRPTVLWLSERGELPFSELPRYVEIGTLVQR